MMKNFNELFEQAKKVGDSRDKVFHDLKEKIVKDLLPEFATAIGVLGYESVVVKTSKAILPDQNINGQFDDQCGTIIHKDGSINDTIERWDGRYLTLEASSETYWSDFSEAELLRSGLIEFVDALESKLEILIEKRDMENKTAESRLV